MIENWWMDVKRKSLNRFAIVFLPDALSVITVCPVTMKTACSWFAFLPDKEKDLSIIIDLTWRQWYAPLLLYQQTTSQGCHHPRQRLMNPGGPNVALDHFFSKSVVGKIMTLLRCSVCLPTCLCGSVSTARFRHTWRHALSFLNWF